METGWAAVGIWVLVGGVGLVVRALVIVGLRTGEGRELAVEAGVRLVKILLGWLEVWVTAQLGRCGRSESPWRGVAGSQVVHVSDGRLSRLHEARRLVGEL
jgi:hypothetical protein